MKNDIVVELLNQNIMCVASHLTLDFSRTSLMCVQTERSTHAMYVVKKIYDLLPCSSISIGNYREQCDNMEHIKSHTIET